MLLQDAYPQELAFNDGILTISDKGASFLASVGFFCFLIGPVHRRRPAEEVLRPQDSRASMAC